MFDDRLQEAANRAEETEAPKVGLRGRLGMTPGA